MRMTVFQDSQVNDGMGTAALRGAWLGRFASDVRDREAAVIERNNNASREER